MRRRDLSGEERALWALATRDVRPGKKRTRKSKDSPLPLFAGLEHASDGQGVRGRPRKPAPAIVNSRSPPTPLPRRAGEGSRSAHLTTPGAKPTPVLGGGDPKADRRAAKGLIPIEASLDLHGLTQAAAHARTSRFILGAQGDGLRLVLVITGKGAGRGGEGRGVIRTRFIDWVEAAPLRAAIARVAPAKPKDGGAGAFYVFLKRKARA